MQAKTKTEPYEYFDPVFDGSSEVPIDTEYDLPDYCGDIQKILKCRAIPEISSYLVSEDILSCEGICDVRILYVDSKGECIRCCEFTKEFSASIQVKGSQEKAVACVKANVEHMVCRAVNARRISLHLAVGLNVYAVIQRKDLITAGIEDSSIEIQEKGLGAHQAVNAICHQFTMEDSIALKNGKPPIETIIRKQVCCKVGDYRLSEDCLTVNGTAEISFLYSSPDGEVEKMTASTEFHQMIDCPGAQEDCLCDIRMVTGECSLIPKEDSVGEHTSVSILIKAFITAFLYKSCEVSMVDDAYSVTAPIDLHYGQSSFLEIFGKHSETLKKKFVLNVNEDEIQKIVDLWSEQEDVLATCEKGKINYRVKYTLCMLYQSGKGKYQYTEKSFDFNQATETEYIQAKKIQTSFTADLWEYRITDKNTVEISTETTVTSLLYSKASMKFLASASFAEDGTAYEHSPGFTVYYATQGETVWSISKKHRALLADVRTQNELYEDTISTPGPILICNR